MIRRRRVGVRYQPTPCTSAILHGRKAGWRNTAYCLAENFILRELDLVEPDQGSLKGHEERLGVPDVLHRNKGDIELQRPYSDLVPVWPRLVKYPELARSSPRSKPVLPRRNRRLFQLRIGFPENMRPKPLSAVLLWLLGKRALEHMHTT